MSPTSYQTAPPRIQFQNLVPPEVDRQYRNRVWGCQETPHSSEKWFPGSSGGLRVCWQDHQDFLLGTAHVLFFAGDFFQGGGIIAEGFETLGTVGILWSLKAEHTTFFGDLVEYIFGIQLLPITPASEALLDPVWAQSVWPRVSAALSRADPVIAPDWQLLLAALRGTHDLTDAQTLVVNPSSLSRSRTNILWWLATRP